MNKKSALIISCFVVLACATGYVVLSSRDTVTRRPQEPKEPYPYHTEDVTFPSEEQGIELAGTLTLPSANGVYPAVVLISGSGPQNRDEEWMGHKPFLVIADHLTRNGIAVLRYDDRGFGKSTGNFHAGTSSDFSRDVQGAVKYLTTRREINQRKIGLIGHSDGAMIAPMVAVDSDMVSFIVLLAGPGIEGGRMFVDRQTILEKKLGIPEEEISASKLRNERLVRIVKTAQNDSILRRELTRFAADVKNSLPDSIVPKGMTKDQFLNHQMNLFASPWFRFFFNYDPVPTLMRVKCPVLALNGDKDVQVPAKENLEAIEAALVRGGNIDHKVIELPGLNHLFQECETGMVREYVTIEQTFSPIALNEITSWILER